MAGSQIHKTDKMTSESIGDEWSHSGPSGRFSVLTKPMPSPRKIHRTLHHTAKVTEGKKRKRRTDGKLCHLMDMPLDVFFEIASKLQPIDILQLTRVSKHFRATFMPKTSRHIWVAARRNIPDLPDCPADLNEAQYASLLFERCCHACGTPRAQKVDYSLRIRFCGPCHIANVQRGSTSMRKLTRHIHQEVYTLLPRSMLKGNGHTLTSRFTSEDNNPTDYYYVSEIQMVATKYLSLRTDKPALEAFVEERQAMAAQMMQHAQDISRWERSRRRRKIEEEDEAMDQRQSSIYAKLFEMGWKREDFSSEWDEEWRVLVRQPRHLTPRIWKTIRPKLEVLLQRNKNLRFQERQIFRYALRKGEFRTFWKALLDSVTAEELRTMPTFPDAVHLPAVSALLLEDDAQLEVTQERWDHVAEAVLHNIEEHRLRVKLNLLTLLDGMHWNEENSDTPSQLSDNVHDFHRLSEPSSLFTCGQSGCGHMDAYPAILQHGHVSDFPWSTHLIKYEQEAAEVVSFVLRAVGLPATTTQADMVSLGSRFACLCGNPKFKKPLKFTSLVRHIVDQNKWYSKKEFQISSSNKADESLSSIFLNDHDLHAPHPRIYLLEPDDLPVVATEADSTIQQFFKFCPICYLVDRDCFVLPTAEDVAYHMRAKHGSDDGAVGYGELRDWLPEGAGVY